MLSVVPCIAIAIDPSSSVAIDKDFFPGNDESGVMVLESYGIGVVAPI